MIKLALIGLGSMGKNYFNTLSSFKDARITHICSKSEQTLASFPEELSKTTDYKSLAGSKVNGIIIVTPGPTHFELASFFLNQSIPILIEKPLTTNYDQALDLLRLQKNTSVLVGHTLLYHPSYAKLKEKLNIIGKIKKVTFVGGNNKPRSDTSLIYDWGPHGVSFFLDLLEDFPRDIELANFKKNNGFSKLNFILNFKQGIKCYLDIDWESLNKKRSLTILGSKGKLVFDDFAKSKLTLNDKTMKCGLTPPLVLVLKDFITTLETGRKPKSSLKFGVDVTRVLDMLEKLAKSDFKSS